MGHKPSVHQKAVYRWVREGSGNLILVAVAGSGKTTTILNAATMMGGYVNICAYNKKIAVEITGKLKAANQPNRIQAGTFHSFGRRNWAKMAPKAVINGYKVSEICEDLKVPEKLSEFVVDLVSMGKNRGFGVLNAIDDWAEWRRVVDHYDLDEALPLDPKKDGVIDVDQIIDDGIGYAVMAYKKSLEMDYEVIDFDDMLLAPLIHEARIWQNDWLLVDEAQDTNPARRELAKRMLKPTGRAIFVGDPAQAIYGFTGADNDSLDIIRREFNCTELPLTVTYRCPKRVVDMARNWVSHITAADSAPEGVVTEITEEQFAQQPPSMFTNQAAMLCRTTAPLMGLAYGLIRRGIPCHIEGKKIGTGLLNLVGKWQTNSIEVLQKKMEDWRDREAKKFLEKKQDKKAEAVIEKVDCINVLIGVLPAEATVQDLKDHIKKLFGDTPEDKTPPHFILSTVHKSKGREWPTVYLYDRRGLMPSKFARQQWQLDQEKNLIYVAVTRAMSNLVEVTR
jgi:Superfamily I DNA and RNA helicases